MGLAPWAVDKTDPKSRNKGMAQMATQPPQGLGWDLRFLGEGQG